MHENLTFAEIFARVPKGKRTDGMAALTAMHVLERTEGKALSTHQIATLLKHHLRSKAPRNMSDTLAKLPPLVERVRADDGSLRWCLTSSGTTRLAEVAQIPCNSTPMHALDVSKLHPRISNAVRDLLRDGHLSEAVGRAAKELNRFVRERTGRNKDEGAYMMHQVFSETENSHRRLLMSSMSEEWERDLQAGLRFLMVGCQTGIANVDKHGLLHLQSGLEALECIALVSYLARQVERAQLLDPNGSSSHAAPLAKAA